MSELVEAVAPSKVILSGEHAVVYGALGLSFAVHLFTKVTISATKISSSFYEYFFDKNSSFFPTQIFTYLSERFHRQHAHFFFQISAKIPLQSGMGSSASLICAAIKAFVTYFAIEIADDEFLTIAISLENLKHGKSSGIDVYTIYYGGFLKYQKSQMTQIAGSLNFPLAIINTGKPASTTKDCLEKVALTMTDDLLGQFSRVTNNIYQALITQNFSFLKEEIGQNEMLLEKIGVVPKRVQNFINELKSFDLSAKVCGAGSIVGDFAGILLVLGDIPAKVNDIIFQYGYQKININIDHHGTRILSI